MIIDFQKYSSIRIGPKVDVFVIEDERDYGDFFVIGGANNILVSDNPQKLAILSSKFDYIKFEDNLLFVGAFTSSRKLFSFCKKNNIQGFEFLQGLPGKVGGLVKMNAGLKGVQIGSFVHLLKSSEGLFLRDDLEFSYRYSNIKGVIFEIVFEVSIGFEALKVEFFKSARANQPSLPSAGSCFKNPPNDYAGRLLEKVGLKGYSVGFASFSNQHANFLVNNGGATFQDCSKLIKLAQYRVFCEFGISLELEVIII